MTTGRINQVATSFSGEQHGRCTIPLKGTAQATDVLRPKTSTNTPKCARAHVATFARTPAALPMDGTTLTTGQIGRPRALNTRLSTAYLPEGRHLRRSRRSRAFYRTEGGTYHTRSQPSPCGCQLHETVRASIRATPVRRAVSGPRHVWTAMLGSAESDLPAGQPLCCLSPC